jgi:mycothiol synthase
MWTCHQAADLPQGTAPLAWFERVLPQSIETHQTQYENAHKALTEGTFDAACTFFAAADDPAGLVTIRTEERIGQLDLIAVRADVRRSGLGTRLLEKAMASCRAQQLQALVATDVHSGNKAVVGLLKKMGFSGQSQGGLRMQRPLDGAWPAWTVPDGFALRPLQPGEEAAWIELKNACFRADGGQDWTLDNFQREFVDSPVYDLDRILVATAGEKLAGTTSAWEWDYGWGPVGLIHWVGVDPQYRGKGLGEAITIRALEQLKARGYADTWLATSRDRHAAVRLYERLGFTVEREFFTYTLEL